MNLIGTLANVLPLLGLLGTVLGMLMSFEVIQSYGRSQPQLLTGGISQALITTQAGLWTAVPVFFFHHIIHRKMRLIRDETEILLHELRQSRNNKFNITDKGELNISESYNV
jgi:biopolymer transport protein ExbB